MHHSGKKLTPLMAALGALAGGGIGAMQVMIVNTVMVH